MTAIEASLLKIEAIVMWDKDPSDLGTVCDLSPTAFEVIWENGKRGWIDFHDAKRVDIKTA